MTTEELIDELHRAAGRTVAPAPFDLDAVRAGGERRLRARRRRRVVAGGITVAGVAAIVAAVPSWLPEQGGTTTPATTSTATQTPPATDDRMTPEAQAMLDQLSPMMSIFTEPQRPEDELPPGTSEHERPGEPYGRYAGSTSRYLGRFDDTRFWIVVAQDGMGCSVEKRDGPDEPVTSGCTGSSADRVIDGMLKPGPAASIEVVRGERPADDRRWLARFVRDGHVPTPEEAAVWTFPSPNLAVAWEDEIPTTDPFYVPPRPDRALPDGE
ncbi:hypothetical protein [Jiangella endophytica]|uniref:hypothetical protein n=1 Tax=Jiangella endophytica TaxID=1623398 RepID=UPI000E351035|nr:hypothetical protein [Jiangella endophytica]